eukprot:752107-Hanusia_phi.AAC.1
MLTRSMMMMMMTTTTMMMVCVGHGGQETGRGVCRLRRLFPAERFPGGRGLNFPPCVGLRGGSSTHSSEIVLKEYGDVDELPSMEEGLEAPAEEEEVERPSISMSDEEEDVGEEDKRKAEELDDALKKWMEFMDARQEDPMLVLRDHPKYQWFMDRQGDVADINASIANMSSLLEEANSTINENPFVSAKWGGGGDDAGASDPEAQGVVSSSPPSYTRELDGRHDVERRGDGPGLRGSRVQQWKEVESQRPACSDAAAALCGTRARTQSPRLISS